MKVRIVSFLLGLAAAVVFWLVIDAGDRGSASGEGGGGARGADADVRSAGAEVGGGETRDDGEGAAADDVGAEREVAGDAGGAAVVGTLVVQADEVDQCLDVRGSVLVLENRSTGRTHRAVILENGGAAFEAVRFAPGRTTFALRTEVPDRACFPAEFVIAHADLTGDPPAAAVSVALIHRHGLRGVVRDAETRRPIEGANVEVDAFEANGTVTDGEGRYALELPEPRGTLVVTAPGFQELLWRYPEETDAGAWLPDRRDFDLLPDRLTAWVDVNATREDGSPAAGAEVEVEPLETRAPPAAALDGISASSRRDFLESLRSDVDAFGAAAGARGDLLDPLDDRGRALLRLRLPGRYRIIVSAGDRAGAAEVDVAAGERVEAAVELAPAAVLLVRARCEGEPVSAAVRYEPAEGGEAISTFTDFGGEARIGPLLPGTAGALVVPASFQPFRSPAPVPVLLPPQGGEVVVSLPLQRRTPVKGEVLDERTGRPIAGARVRWLDADRVPDPTTERRTDAAGRFETAAPPGGVLRAEAFEYRGGEAARAGAAGELAPIRLAPIELDPFDGSTRARLRTVDPTGAPLAGARVRIDATLIHADGRTEPGFSHLGGESVEGGLVLPTLGWPLRPGESVRLAVVARTSERSGVAESVVAHGEDRDIDVVLRGSAAITGTVRLDGALPIGDVVVRWVPDGDRDPVETTSGDDGTFRLDGAPSGPGTLTARLPFRAAERRLELSEEGASGVVLSLEAHDPP